MFPRNPEAGARSDSYPMGLPRVGGASLGFGARNMVQVLESPAGAVAGRGLKGSVHTYVQER